MKYTLFFLMLSWLLFKFFLEGSILWKALIDWPLLSTYAMSLCYFTNRTHWVKEKDENGAVNCANGHDSSFTALLLVENGTCADTAAALKLVQQNRSQAVPNASQRKWLLNRERAR